MPWTAFRHRFRHHDVTELGTGMSASSLGDVAVFVPQSKPHPSRAGAGPEIRLDRHESQVLPERDGTGGLAENLDLICTCLSGGLDAVLRQHPSVAFPT